MNRRACLIGLAVLASGVVLASSTRDAYGWGRGGWGGGMGSAYAWHGNYYHVAWGQPVALVVPPTVRWQSHYSWGVPSVRVTPIYHQFGSGYVAPGGGMGFYPPPVWPSSTDQLGVYPVRGPW